MTNPTTDDIPETSPDSTPENGAGSDAASSENNTEEGSSSKLQADFERFKDLALRTQADFDNYRKRAAREKEDAVKYANGSFLERLIPILDNFELGLQAARSTAENSPILAGMDMVAKQLHDFLLGQGVEPIVTEGAKFDPNLHEAVAQEESAEVPEGVVLRQLRRGYKLRDRLLRPSTVVVSKGPAA